MSDADLYRKLASPVDRLREAHWFIHQLELHYHEANEFRWCLNCFLRSLKEVLQLLSYGFQNVAGFSKWFRPKRDSLRENALISRLSQARDFVVHQAMLIPSSYGYIGITEGRGLKLGIGMEIDPMKDSDEEMTNYVAAAAIHGDVMELFKDDEESVPCIERSWRIKEFPDQDILDVVADPWLGMSQLVNDAVLFLGDEPFDFNLKCRHSSNRVKVKMYDRKKLRNQMLELQNGKLEFQAMRGKSGPNATLAKAPSKSRR